MIDDSFRRGFMADKALQARESYRFALGLVLVIEGAGALALILAPLGVAALLGAETQSAAWPRLAGIMLLVLVGHMMIGRSMPSAHKVMNLCGFLGRALIGLFALASGGWFVLIGLCWFAAAGWLALLYFKFFEVEVMNRP